MTTFTESKTLSLQSAFSIITATAYGPFLVMAIYTQMFVPCPHCKESAWRVLPTGPLTIPLFWAQNQLSFPVVWESLGISLGIILMFAVISGLVWFTYRSSLLLSVTASIIAILCSLFAFGTLALIQM